MKNLLYTMSIILSLLIAPNLYADYGHNKSHRHYDSRHYFNRDLKAAVKKQHRRIAKGIDKGLLTRKEVRKLEKKHDRLFRMKRNFWSDRHLSRWERHLLTEQLDLINNKIYDYKHNDRYRRNYHRYSGYDYNRNGYKQDRVAYDDQHRTYKYRKSWKH